MPAPHSAERLPIERLRYQSAFVARLPGDPLRTNTCRQVHGACFSHVQPTAVTAPTIVALVPEVAALLDLSIDETPSLTAALAGNLIVEGMVPYAACYGGHQFGSWAGQLGDGRAITLCEVENARGERWEMQLKGAGVTPYSRRGDGRAVLRSSLRELVCSEAMFHLGVPTTRALSLVSTGDRVMRDMLYDGNAAFEPGAIVCRVAPTFLRFGSYEIHAARNDLDTLRRLLRFTMETHYPAFVDGERLDLPAFLAEVARRTAVMIVGWMRVGFVHGVMNTDNMSIVGLTIDYGPYGWLDDFDPGWTPNTTDASGKRYRFGNQPKIAHWNLLQLAQTLATLVDDVGPLERALGAYGEALRVLEPQMMASKLGLTSRPELDEEDQQLVSALFAALLSTETDMTLFYRGLAEVPLGAGVSAEARIAPLRDAFYAPDALGTAAIDPLARWLDRYAARLRGEGSVAADRARRMNAVNPLYVPRNYLVQEVIDETAKGDRAPLEVLLAVLRRPYDVQPGREAFAGKRPEWARHRVGCSMLSCSS